MFSQLNSFSFVGVSNSEMLLSEKDLNSMEFNFLVRPALDFQDECSIIAPLQASDPEELHEDDDDDDEEDHEEQECNRHEQKQKQEEEDKCKFLISSLKIKLPSFGEFKIQEQDPTESEAKEEEEEDLDDGCKTPTSSSHKIPVMLPCPPAPRKPKALPSNKRKSPALRRRVLLDLSNEIESLFPPALRADLGAKIKKVRQENDKK